MEEEKKWFFSFENAYIVLMALNKMSRCMYVISNSYQQFYFTIVL